MRWRISAFILLLAGCTQTSNSSAVIDAVSDPAGDAEIVRVSAAQLDNAPALAVTQELQIDGNGDGDTQFTDIRGVEFKDGETYVVDPLSNHVRVYDLDGNLVRKWGGRGGGPGEINGPRRIGISHDTVYVMDDRMLHRFTTQGDYISRSDILLNFTHKDFGGYSARPETMHMSARGIVSNIMIRELMKSRTIVSPDTFSLFIIDPVTGVSQPQFQRILTTDIYPTTASGFSTALLAPDVQDFTVMNDGHVIVTGRDGISLNFHMDGALVRRIEFDTPRRTVTTQDIADILARREVKWEAVTRMSNVSVPKDYVKRNREGVRKLPHAKYHSVVGRTLVGDDNSLLVLRPDLSAGSFGWDGGSGQTVWMLMTADGTVEGRIELPAGFEPLVLRSDMIVGKTIDEDDVPSISGYRISRAKDRSAAL